MSIHALRYVLWRSLFFVESPPIYSPFCCELLGQRRAWRTTKQLHARPVPKHNAQRHLREYGIPVRWLAKSLIGIGSRDLLTVGALLVALWSGFGVDVGAGVEADDALELCGLPVQPIPGAAMSYAHTSMAKY